MTYYYRARPTYTNEIHHIVGALIIFGGLSLLVGMLIMDLEIMIFGSGLMTLASLGGVCSLDSSYKVNHYEQWTDNQLERGEVDEDSE